MKSRKLFAALLCALLCLLVAGIAFAADESPVIASGDCGDNGNNVTWKLTEDGTLTISGSGAMKNYSYYSGVPWYSYQTVVKNAVIESCVNDIGNYAFCGCNSLASITIPNSVLSIGQGAFSGCSSLISVSIPDNVMSIGAGAFGSCSRLTSITIPENVINIGYEAFYGCSSLTSVAIPDGVTSIGRNTFYGCSSLTSITIPDSVTSLGDYVFCDCSSLTSITIPDSVTSIGTSTFESCSSLISITLPDGVTSIGREAFSGCSSLTSVIIPGSVTSIGDYAFFNCRKLASISLPDGMISIGNSVFCNCSNLKDVYYQGSITEWLNLIFSACYSNPCYSGANLYISGNKVTDITIPEDVTSINEYAFYGCSSLTSITFPDGVTSIGSRAFRGCSSLTSIILPDDVTSIGDEAFYRCSSLTSITIPDGVTSIGYGTFFGCSSLTSISIPDSVTGISSSTFCGCSSLTGITIPDSVTSIGSSAFDGCSSLTSVIIPDNVTDIGSHAFCDCSNLTSINIPDGVTSIGGSAFFGCSSLTSINITDGVTSIDYEAFYNCYNLSIYLPDNITSIGYDALYNVGRIYCKPHTVTSASVVKYGSKYYIPGNDFRLTESDDRVKVYSYSGSRNNAAIPDGINEWIYSSTISNVRLPNTLCETDVFTLKATAVTVPEGVTAMGTLSLSGVQKIFIPASVTDMSGVNITDGSTPTMYCEMDSEAELWAIVNGYDIIYTNGTGWDDTCVLTYVGKEIWLDIGEEYTLSASDFSIQPIPTGDISVTLTGNTKVSADGLTLKGKKAGNTNITATMAGRTVNVPVHVYKKVTSFVLTSQRFAEAGESFTVALSDALPADISGKFTWQQDGGIPVTDTVLTRTFTAPSQPGSTVITVTAPGGYSQSVTVTVAGSISAPYAGSNSRAAVTGSFIDICVDVDGVTYRNTAELYGEVTVPATAAGIIELTEDGRIHVIGSGRTAFSVTGLDGKKVNFIVVTSEAGGVLTLPAGTVSIGEEAFAGTAAQKAILPSGCMSIGSRAFAGSAVQIVNVPASVTSIADDAFNGCSVTVYCPAGSYAESWCAAHGVNCVAE